MKILMLTPYLPYPPSSGGQVRSYNLLKNLGQKHDISLVSLIKEEKEKKYVKYLKSYCRKIHICKRSESPWTVKNIIRSIFGLYPFLVVRNFSQEAKETIHRLLEKENFDLIHAETFYIMPHIPETDIPILLVEQTIEYQVYQHFVNSLAYFFIKPLFYFDILKLKFWEKTFWNKADLVAAVSQADRRKMLEISPKLKVKVIPNAAGEDLMNLFEKKVKHKKKPIFLYQGNFFWLQNVEAAEILAKDIFPKIKKRLKKATCYIAGQKAEDKIGRLKKYGVEIVDIDPSDIETVKKVYRESSIFLAPIKGPGGTRLKILGAMAAGLPVVSSRTGIEGLAVRDGKEVLIAQGEDEFVEKTVKIVNDKKLYEKVRKKARKLVEDNYSWPKIAKKLETVYLELKKGV